MQMLAAVLPGPDGRLPDPLRAGIVPPTEEELAGWSVLPPGAEELASDGARPNDAGAAQEFRLRTTAEPSVDGQRHRRAARRSSAEDSAFRRSRCERLDAAGAGTDDGRDGTVFEGLLRGGRRPRGPTVENVELLVDGEPDYVDPEGARDRPLAQGRVRARARCPSGARPLGGSIPVVASLVARGVAGDRHPASRVRRPQCTPRTSASRSRALREGLETTVEVLRRFERAWLNARYSGPSGRGARRGECSNAFCATSWSTRRSRSEHQTTYPSTQEKQLDLSRPARRENCGKIGLDDVGLDGAGIRVSPRFPAPRAARRGRRPWG